MTKLNITNKRLYKLKKHRNQSKKNFPKKRKNRRRRRRGGGKSFRKRRKYNIKNNSIKSYHQKGGQVETDEDEEESNRRREETKARLTSAGKEEMKTENSPWKSILISAIKDDNDDWKNIIIKNVGYKKTDKAYAKEAPRIQGDEKGFYNYFFQKSITKNNKTKELLVMIQERISRHINQIIKTDGLDGIYNSTEKKNAALKQIGDKVEEIFLKETNNKLRNIIKEKIDALTFLHWLLELTKNHEGVNFEDDIKTTIDGETLNTLFYLYVDKYNPNAELLEMAGTINTPIDEGNERKKITKSIEKINQAPQLIKCSDIPQNDQFLEDKLNLALGKLLENFDKKDWTKLETKEFDDNVELNQKTGQMSELEDGLKQVHDNKLEELKKIIEKITPQEGNDLTALKAKIETLKEKIKEKKSSVASKGTEMAEINQHVAEEEAQKYEGKLKEKEEEIQSKQKELEGKKEEIDGLNAKIVGLEQSIQKCGESDQEKMKKLKEELETEKAKLEAANAELKAKNDEIDTLNQQRESTQKNLNDANNDVNEANSALEESRQNQDNIENPTEISDASLIDSDNEDEEDASAYLDNVTSGKDGKGVIKAPMAPDDEVIVYLKRRPDGKFIVSTLGTGGDDGDATNLWISNIGHTTEPPAGEKTEVHSN